MLTLGMTDLCCPFIQEDVFMSNNNEKKDFIDLREDTAEDTKREIPPNQQPPSYPPTYVTPPYSAPKCKPRKRKNGATIAIIILSVLVLFLLGSLVLGSVFFGPNQTFGFNRDVSVTNRSDSRLFMATGEVSDLTFALSDISAIDVSLRTTEIEVIAHNGNDIRIYYNPPGRGDFNRPLYSFNSDTGRLEIFPEYRIFTQVNVVSFNNSRDKLQIYLPRNMGETLDEFNLVSTTGRIIVTYPGMLAKNAAITATTGRIRLNDFEVSKELNVASTTGRVEAANITVGGNNINGNARFSNTTGGISITNLQASGDAEVRTSTGRISVKDLTAEGIEIRSTTGRVNLDGVTAMDNMSASATTGTINAGSLAANRDLSIRATTGRVDLSDSKIDGQLSVRTSTGTVSLNRVNTDFGRASIDTNRNTGVTIR
jgi:DUF4097 and DUF4098 domain-containing protein YvlB